ncbi:MAG: hypothetical protein RIR12_485 [Bacteroidota bacterium]
MPLAIVRKITTFHCDGLLYIHVLIPFYKLYCQMKKVIIAVGVLLIVTIPASYLFVSNKLKVGADAFASLNIKAIEREMLDTSTWKKWWPGDRLFTYKGAQFLFEKPLPGTTKFAMIYNKDTLPGLLLFTDNKDGRSYILWRCELTTGNNPITKWIKYVKARKIKSLLTELTNTLSGHLTEKNIYGFTPVKSKVKDSILLTTKTIFDHYPTLQELKQLELKLFGYLAKQKVTPKSKPMLSVIKDGNEQYFTMMGVATDVFIPSTLGFEPKLVLKNGNIIEAEYKGGPIATQNAYAQFETYKNDMLFSAPAISYQLLVTDRSTEPDTSKWITRFYYPVF